MKTWGEQIDEYQPIRRIEVSKTERTRKGLQFGVRVVKVIVLMILAFLSPFVALFYLWVWKEALAPLF